MRPRHHLFPCESESIHLVFQLTQTPSKTYFPALEAALFNGAEEGVLFDTNSFDGATVDVLDGAFALTGSGVLSLMY